MITIHNVMFESCSSVYFIKTTAGKETIFKCSFAVNMHQSGTQPLSPYHSRNLSSQLTAKHTHIYLSSPIYFLVSDRVIFPLVLSNILFLLLVCLILLHIQAILASVSYFQQLMLAGFLVLAVPRAF